MEPRCGFIFLWMRSYQYGVDCCAGKKGIGRFAEIAIAIWPFRGAGEQKKGKKVIRYFLATKDVFTL